jgi:predicted acetyltransferase
MAITVRNIEPAETAAWFDTLMTAFMERWDTRIVEDVQSLWDFRRVWAAFEGERIVGTVRSWATELTLPGGGLLPGSAVAAVSVLPTHRRRGALSRMLPLELGAARERGEAVALLYASEYPIYGRYGFGPAVPSATWTVEGGRGRFPGAPSPDTIRFVEPSPDARDVVKGIFHAWRKRQPGEIWRREFTWDDDLGLMEAAWRPRWKGFLALHHDPDGRPDGYARYHVEEQWQRRQPAYMLHLDELHVLSHEAYVDLWRFVTEMDWVATVRAERRAIDERLPWLLTNARAAQVADSGDGMWLALLDAPRALAARTYERPGRLVIETVTARGTDAERRDRVLLDASPEGATCTATDQPADLVVDARAVGAAYLGGARLRDAVLLEGADEYRPGALAEADALFRTADVPWCSTHF